MNYRQRGEAREGQREEKVEAGNKKKKEVVDRAGRVWEVCMAKSELSKEGKCRW